MQGSRRGGHRQASDAAPEGAPYQHGACSELHEVAGSVHRGLPRALRGMIRLKVPFMRMRLVETMQRCLSSGSDSQSPAC